MQSFIDSIVSFEAKNWPGQLALLIAQLPGIIVALTNYPKTDGFLKNLLTVLQLFSNFQHKNSPGTLKLPLTFAKPPTVVGSPVASPAGGTPIGKLGILFVACMVTSLSACAGVSWSQPVFYAGPTVAPIEEVSAKNPTPAVAAGFQQTIGLGSYEMLERSWDVADVGLLELGGLALPGAGPSGQLQLGVKVGTLNGLVGVGVLFDCVDGNGGGLCQGGSQGGPILAGLFDIQALVAWFGSDTSGDAVSFHERLPRGGL